MGADPQLQSTRVRLMVGDITKLAVDAMVSATSSTLSGSSGVGRAIHRAAGPHLLIACRKIGICPTGQARITPGFGLPARFVIHAVGPMWHGGASGESELLASAYQHSLSLAQGNGCLTIAFPAISCGRFGYPIPAACAIALQTIHQTCAASPGIDRVLLVAFDDHVARAYRDLGVPEIRFGATM